LWGLFGFVLGFPSYSFVLLLFGGVCHFCFASFLCVIFSMSQQRQFQMGGGNNPGQYNDTTLTKIFVGGLAWETQRDTMRRYFEQFGDILEAVVITDKNTGRSKGYGFVSPFSFHFDSLVFQCHFSFVSFICIYDFQKTGLFFWVS
jgi:hypothetical protein